jgi:hypothetical protein
MKYQVIKAGTIYGTIQIPLPGLPDAGAMY